MVYDPQSRQTTVVLKGLSFANGLARSEDGTSLFVAETGKYRIWKVDINTRNVDEPPLFLSKNPDRQLPGIRIT